MPVVLQLIDAHKRYGHQELLDGASCALADDQKVGLIGRNGAGKSTLCRVLLGDEELDAGEVVRGRQLRLGYLRQHDPFHPGETVREFLMRDSGQPDWRCGEVAWKFQFPDEMVDQPVRELSGGWQTRTKLASLLRDAIPSGYMAKVLRWTAPHMALFMTTKRTGRSCNAAA